MLTDRSMPRALAAWAASKSHIITVKPALVTTAIKGKIFSITKQILR